MADKKDSPPLVAAAEALDAELRHLEALAAGAAKEPLTSQKHLERAARALGGLSDLEVRLREALGRLVETIAGAGQRQNAALEALAARAREIEQRFELWKQLAARRDALGAQGGVVNQQIAAALAEGDGRAAIPAALEALARAAQEGEALHALAREHEFNDLAREADSIRQQVQNLRRKLSHMGGDAEPAGEAGPGGE